MTPGKTYTFRNDAGQLITWLIVSVDDKAGQLHARLKQADGDYGAPKLFTIETFERVYRRYGVSEEATPCKTQ